MTRPYNYDHNLECEIIFGLRAFPGMTRTPGVWIDTYGKTHRYCEMSTGHLFNSAKLLFNHLAMVHNGKLVMHLRTYPYFKKKARREPAMMAQHCLEMLREVRRRGNLDRKYQQALKDILAQG